MPNPTLIECPGFIGVLVLFVFLFLGILSLLDSDSVDTDRKQERGGTWYHARMELETLQLYGIPLRIRPTLFGHLTKYTNLLDMSVSN